MSYRLRKKILEWIAIAACWLVALLIFPIIWMFLTSLKTEGGAVARLAPCPRPASWLRPSQQQPCPSGLRG